MIPFIAEFLVSVGVLMSPAGGGGGAPPSPTFVITTESGTKLATEGTVLIRTETDTP